MSPILKTSVLPITAAATKLRYGSELEVEVRLQGTKPGIFKTNGKSKKIRFFGTCYAKLLV
ncbi:MAG: hypothetical protein H7Y18_15675 [Clostridiaceae bacterium]|nr:hypothetical protein [Clostridiaceae bacterium]